MDAERDYDMILDILFRSITENYGEDEYNLALDMVKLQESYMTDFEKLMKEKHQREALIKQAI